MGYFIHQTAKMETINNSPVTTEWGFYIMGKLISLKILVIRLEPWTGFSNSLFSIKD